MPTGKRASMREGPLAALFRKTADDSGAKEDKPQLPPAEPEKRGAPHPALEQSAPAPAEETHRVPSPQERLRHAFSSDIPENLLDPPTRRAQPAQDVYARPERS